LEGGASRAEVVQRIAASPEYRALQVRDAYAALLGRAVESPQVLDDWVRYLADHTADQFRAQLLGSAEYSPKHGGTDAGFLGGLFDAALGRQPGAADLAFYGAALAGGTPRSEVALKVLSSLEAGRRRVMDDYRVFLHREADPTGLGGWSGALQGGMTDGQLVAALLGSPEYWQNL